MGFSIRNTILAYAAPNARLLCSPALWTSIVRELHARGKEFRESGCFLLGNLEDRRRHVRAAIYYDDLDPVALKSGAIALRSAAYAELWSQCAELKMSVVGDIHTHGGRAQQSSVDRAHPMIPQIGHIGMILPNFARLRSDDIIGIFEYLGGREWRDHTNTRGFFYVGLGA